MLKIERIKDVTELMDLLNNNPAKLISKINEIIDTINY